MKYAELERKRKYYRDNKHLLPREVVSNYEAAFRIEYTHNSTAIEGNTLSLMERLDIQKIMYLLLSEPLGYTLSLSAYIRLRTATGGPPE